MTPPPLEPVELATYILRFMDCQKGLVIQKAQRGSGSSHNCMNTMEITWKCYNRSGSTLQLWHAETGAGAGFRRLPMLSEATRFENRKSCFNPSPAERPPATKSIQRLGQVKNPTSDRGTEVSRVAIEICNRNCAIGNRASRRSAARASCAAGTSS